MPRLAAADRRHTLMNTLEALEREGVHVEPARLRQAIALLRNELLADDARADPTGEPIDTSGAGRDPFKAAVDALPDAVFLCAPDGHVRHVNAAAERALDAQAGTLVGRRPVDLLPDIAATWDAAVAAALRDGTPQRRQVAVTLPMGTRQWLLTAVPLREPAAGADACAAVLCVVHDCTDQVVAERSLAQGDARLRVILAAAPICAYATDVDLRYTWVMAARADFAADEMVGRTDDELLPPESVADLIAFKREVLACGARLRRQVTVNVDGVPLTYDVTAEPLRDAAGRVTGLLAAALDVSEVVRDCRAAQAANLAKDRLLATLSHELRTPLTPVLTTAQLLAADPTLVDGHRDAARLICRNVELAARLIDDLLDLTRIVHGKLEVRLDRVNLHEKVEAVIAMLRDDAAAKGVTICPALDAANRFIEADAARIQQVAWNLLRNAIKFTPAGGHIDVRTADVGGDRVSLVVADNGIGIEPPLLPRIFDAFEQGGRDTTRHFGGLGLGLSITKAIVALHGGTIDAHSAGRNAGATFTVELAASPTREADADADADDNVEPAGDDLAGLSILLVEDHADARLVLTLFLRSLGCAVQAADGCTQALALAAGARFDLVVSDLGLPDGSGHDLMRRLRAAGGPPGIALSGYGMEDDRARSEAAGFAEHLVKPVDIATLAQAIRRALPNPTGRAADHDDNHRVGDDHDDDGHHGIGTRSSIG